jgi:hypothetical protein
MSDEEGNLEASSGNAKVSKRARLRGVLRKGVDKIKRKDDEYKQDTTFTLGDNVKDFLAGGLPPASDRVAIATPGHGDQAGSAAELRDGNQPSLHTRLHQKICCHNFPRPHASRYHVSTYLDLLAFLMLEK